MNGARQTWIDWMKVLGMLAVVWGHCFPPQLSAFVYAFNVPVFFLLSGYLSHPEPSMGQCLNKVWRTLGIPYLILATLKAAGYMLGHIGDGQWLWSVVAIAGGFHQLHGAAGCSNLWFVYTLILVKIVYNVMPRRRLWLALGAILAAAIYRACGLEWMWSVTNVALALPFFMLGNALRDASWVKKVNQVRPLVALIGFALCAALTYGISLFNGSAMLFMCKFGGNALLFVAAALTGCAMIWLLSLALGRYDSRALRLSAAGTIVTLVFHRELLHPLIKFINGQGWSVWLTNAALFASSVAVMFAFIPIIYYVNRSCPVMLGGRGKALIK